MTIIFLIAITPTHKHDTQATATRWRCWFQCSFVRFWLYGVWRYHADNHVAAVGRRMSDVTKSCQVSGNDDQRCLLLPTDTTHSLYKRHDLLNATRRRPFSSSAVSTSSSIDCTGFHQSRLPSVSHVDGTVRVPLNLRWWFFLRCQ